ncbi:MAG TPA: hypothetical protein PLX89_05545 [Verrucomicrobiota bacterium]|nr:hypothetical protein [Verrucomicrobiota bacterium]
MNPPRKLRRKRERIAGRKAEAEAENEEWWKERDLNSWFIWAWGDDGFSESFCWDDDTETSESETTVVFQSGFQRGLELPAPVLEWATAGVATDPNVRTDVDRLLSTPSASHRPSSSDF